MIDTSELLRVFGELKSDCLQAAVSSGDAALMAELEALRRLVAAQDAQLQNAMEREEWMRQHVAQVTGAIRLLENKSGTGQAEKLQVELNRVKKIGQRQLNELQTALESERRKGFWARIFDRSA